MTEARSAAAVGQRGATVAWVTAGLVVLVALVGTSSLTIVSWLGARTVDETHTYPAAGLRQVDLDTGSGTVRVVGGVGDAVTVERRVRHSWSRARLVERVDGDTLRISADCLGWLDFSCRTDYTVQVPRGVSVRARTSSGDMVVRGVDGDVRVSSSSGDLSVSRVDGNVRATTSSGDIDVADVGGHLSVTVSSGDIAATGLRSAEAEATSSSGDVRLEFSRAPNLVQVTVSSGDVEIAVPGRDSYRVTTRTSSGSENVDVVQDPAASRSVTVHSSSGDVWVRYLGS